MNSKLWVISMRTIARDAIAVFTLVATGTILADAAKASCDHRPPPPEPLSVNSNANSITISWTPKAGWVDLSVKRKKTNALVFNVAGGLGGQHRLVVPNLPTNEDFEVMIRSRDETGTKGCVSVPPIVLTVKTEAPAPVTPPTPTPPPSTSLTPDQNAILAKHNAYRQTCGAPNMVWDAGLAANAARWASGCHTDKFGNFCHQFQSSADCPGAPGGNQNGESTSFAWRTTQQGSGPVQSVTPGETPADAVKGWYCEVSRFPFDSPNPTIAGGFTGNNCSGTATGHFTQVVWKSTTRLGCASNTCAVPGKPGMTGTLWVCEYAPAGNVNTPQQILANVSKSCTRQP